MKSNRLPIILSGAALGILILVIAASASYFLKLNSEADWKSQAQNLSLILTEHAAQTLLFASDAADSIEDAIPINNQKDQTQFNDYVSQRSFYDILRDKVQTNPLIEVASITSNSGQIINWSRSFPSPGLSISDRVYFQTLKQNKTKKIVFSDPVKSKGSGKWLFYASKRLQTERGEFLGTIQVGISIDNFSEFYKKVVNNIGEGASILLYKDDATLMTSFPLKEDMVGVKVNGNVKKLLIDTGLDNTVAIVNSPRLILKDQSETRIIAPRRVIGFPFIVTPMISDNVYLKSWTNALLYIWSIALLSIALLIFFTKTVLDKNLQILEELDEIAEAEESLRYSQKIIEQQNLNLDRKVKERTQELEENQLRLEKTNAMLEKSSRHKSEFLANMSHELRTPLNSIIGFSELLKEKTFGELNTKQIGYAQYIFDSGKHLLELINDILNLSKIEAGEVELILSNFSLNDIVESSISLVSERAAQAKITLGVLHDGIDYEMYADERKVKQTLLNLLTNAIKFTPAGGSVIVLVEKNTDGVTIAVTDTGIGIDPKDQDTIFETFTQVDNPFTRTTEGTGLGLSIAKYLVEKQGGWLQLQSEIGKGSIFTFFIPQQNKEIHSGVHPHS